MTFKISIAGACLKAAGVRGGLSASLAALSLAASAHAATYIYTGKDFTDFTIPTTYSTSDSVTGSLTLTAPLADNITSFTNLPKSSITSFSFSDGRQTITDANATLTAFSFETDGSGNITKWQVAIDISSTDSIATVNAPQSGVFDSGTLTLSDMADNRRLPGTWSLVSSGTPEPATWAVMLTGFGAIGAALRRRRPSAATARPSCSPPR